MAPDEPSKKQPKQKDQTEVIGYPDKPMPKFYVTLAAAAWTIWLIFLMVMAYVRWHEWPSWPT